MTRLIRGIYNIAPQHTGGVITIGNFDGVHEGHKALINKVRQQADALQAPSIVMTFEPQPLEFFKGNQGVARLTRFREKYHALARTGVDYVLVVQFNQTVANWSPEVFVKSILIDHLAAKYVIVGDDFRFGRHRQGDFSCLNQMSQQLGFGLASMPSIQLNEARISSTRIRQALADNQLELAERLLGHPYQMMGRVVHGDKLGRTLGFPTANIYLHRAITPVQGIYIVRMQGIANRPLPGVANIGIRPTVGGTRSLLEVYLFDFDQDIYGKQVSVEFCEKIRAEERYANLELLKAAISSDAIKARDYFEKRGEL